MSLIGLFAWFTYICKFIKPHVSSAETAVGWNFKQCQKFRNQSNNLIYIGIYFKLLFICPQPNSMRI
jgi:hypothetical protein